MAKAEPRRTAFEVFLDAIDLGVQQKVGTLYRDAARTALPPSFEYDGTWLATERVFMLDPRLELWPGEQRPPAGVPAFGIFMDSAPDRWGRLLMERREAAAAARAGRKPRRLQEMDFLLGVHDKTRLGALRLRSAQGGPFLDDSENAVPPFSTLRELSYISQRVVEIGSEKLPEYEQWLATLMAPGSSLGGARPKASFADSDGRLWIAKFPAKEDRYDVGAWEFVVHKLARKAGISIPHARLEALVEPYHTFCVARFDRTGSDRHMFASAMTLLDRHDGQETASYLDLAQLISDDGASGHVDEDLEQLFRRVVFNVLVGNRDDHLRNHGFLREPDGWRLAPAYDMNPNPYVAEHSLTLDGATAAPSLDVVADTAEIYRLDRMVARRIMNEVLATVASWQKVAKSVGLSRLEISQMESVMPD